MVSDTLPCFTGQGIPAFCGTGRFDTVKRWLPDLLPTAQYSFPPETWNVQFATAHLSWQRCGRVRDVACECRGNGGDCFANTILTAYHVCDSTVCFKRSYLHFVSSAVIASSSTPVPCYPSPINNSVCTSITTDISRLSRSASRRILGELQL